MRLHTLSLLVPVALWGGCGASHAPSTAEPPSPAEEPESIGAVGVPAFVLQRGHTQDLRTAVFAADGRRVLTTGDDGTAKIWDAESGVLQAALAGHSAAVLSATFSPDGRRVVTASDDKTARVWDTATGAVLARLEGHTAGVVTAAFDAEGARVVTGSGDNTARVWNAETGAVTATLQGHGHWVMSASFSADGTRVLTSSRDSTARIWDAASGDLVHALEGHERTVMQARFSPDGEIVVSISDDGTARLWNAADGSLITTLQGHEGMVERCEFSPDGARLVTAGQDGVAILWRASDGKALRRLDGQAGPLKVATFSRDGRMVVTGTLLGSLGLWTVDDGQLVGAFGAGDDAIQAASFSPDGTRLVSGGGGGSARVWDVASRQLIVALQAHTSMTAAAMFSPDGRMVVTSRLEAPTLRSDARTGAPLGEFAGSQTPIRLAFSPDGQRIAMVSVFAGSGVWNTSTGEKQLELDMRCNMMGACFAGYSARGDRMITSGGRGMVQVRDAATGEVTRTIEHADVGYAVFDPSADRIVTTSRDGTAKIWATATGQLQATLQGHTGFVFTAAFSPDGGRVATTGQDNTTRVWEVSSGNLVTTIDDHLQPVVALTFSPDGRRLLTREHQGRARQWDASTGDAAPLEGLPDTFATFDAYEGDGERLIVGFGDGAIRVWSRSGESLGVLVGGDGQVRDVHEHRPGWYSAVGESGRLTHHRLPLAGADLRAASLQVDGFVTPDGASASLYSTADGLFTGDEAAFDEVFFRLGTTLDAMDVVSADQLFERFHRSTLARDFWEGRAVELPDELQGGVGLPPVVEMEPIGPRIDRQRVTLRLRVEGRGGGTGEIRVYVNGARVGARLTTGGGDTGRGQSGGADTRGLGLVADQDVRLQNALRRARELCADTMCGRGQHEVELHLAPGQNVITAEAYSVVGQVRGRRATQVVHVDVQDPRLPTLHLLALSVGAHADPSIDLAFAGADADAIAEAFGRQRGRLFERVEVVRIADADATSENIEEALENIREQARPQDVFIGYIASHGVVGACDEESSSYRVILHAATREDPCRDSLSVDALTQQVARLPAHEKLLLLDTCHSGGAVDAGLLDQLRGQLRDDGMRNARAAGVAVVAASAASEVSFEIAELGHGLFTVALLRGLEGRATFRGGRRIGVANLVQYVTRHLPILSERFVQTHQTPTYGMIGSDFTVAMLQEGDAPLLAVAEETALESVQQSEQGLGLAVPSGGPEADVRRTIGERAAALAACVERSRFEAVARWDRTGRVSFDVEGARPGCVAQALPATTVSSPGRGGEVRVVLGEPRSGGGAPP